MPPVFGGAPKCPTCQRSVYFAEQTLGPGGRSFHKLCLKCVNCGKSLEPRLLVDHDGQAYCKACHGKSFGTKGYGAGGALVGEYRPRSSPTRPTTNSATNSPSTSPTRPSVASFSPSLSDSISRPPTIPPKPSFNSSSTPFSQPTTRPPLPTPPPRPTTNSNPTPSSRPRFDSEPLASAPPAPPSAAPSAPHRAPAPTSSRSTPAFSDDEEEPETSTTTRRPLPFAPSTQFAPKSLSSSGDLCRRCGTQVYFAEQVIAVGSKWHKRCLRCASCSTTLNSHLLEKDRLPYCKKCYQDQFGTGSLGITSRPTLY
ncbi:hypothetical protein JCM16303_005638 [Sporobolomyces ruberrimus]